VRRRSRTPVRRSRSRSRGGDPYWQKKLNRLIDDGIVRPGELDNMTLDALEDLSSDLAECAIERFAEANFSRINNKSGFLMGIIRRVKEDGPDGGHVNMDILSRSVRHRLRDLMDDGKLSNTEVDQRMVKALSDLPSELGLEAVDKFATSNLDSVRSKTGFMMGIIKRVAQEGMMGGRPPMGGGWGGGYGPPPGMYGGGGYGGGGYGGGPRGGYGGGGGGYGGGGYDDRDRYGGGGGYDRRY
jgi:hypothetical protein